MMQLDKMRRKIGWLTFTEGEHAPEAVEVPEGAVPAHDTKSPSKRLRSVLYVLYEQVKPGTEFDAWYTQQMEKFIELVKGKLED
jgi:hypothetical protein